MPPDGRPVASTSKQGRSKVKTVKSPFKFKGGVHPDYNKDLARGKAIEAVPVPAELVVSMSQHLGAPAKCVVKAGDYVVKG